ncbi:MAG TPA: site-2 protease family protein [Parcubacteria group bacterium]|jgi:Zn-dependent protease|nr:site-2 protease family protein [Parcubacteria group bacterium]
MQIDFIFSIVILIFSVVVHEVAHGYMAYMLGDNTAKYEGRLNLNPLNHLELFGSFLLPVASYFLGGFIIGWAKPVPFNPYNLRDQKWGEAKVAMAGPLSNILIALFFGLLIRFGILTSLGESFLYIGTMIVFINLVLATFNLIPIPPLDGSKILFSFLPYSKNNIRDWMEQNGIFLMLFFVFFLWKFIVPIVYWEFILITGLSI